MKKLYILFVALFVVNVANAQLSNSSKIYYDISGNEQAFSVAKTFDNCYIIAGEKDQNGLVMKIDTGGNIMWNKKIGNDNATSLIQIIATNDSCFILLGHCLNSAHDANDLLYVKIKSNGDTLWSKSIDLGGTEYPTSIQQTSDNGFIISGTNLQSSTTPETVMFIIKLDAAGNLTWLRKITCGNNDNLAYSVKQIPDSGYIVIGYFENQIGSSFDGRGCLLKLTATGNVSWAKSTNQSYVWGQDIAITSNGIICYLGYNAGGGTVIMKTDFSGNVLWRKTYSSNSGNNVINMPSPKLTPIFDNGFVFINGVQFSPGNLLKIDSTGNLIWSKSMILIPSHVIETSDTGLLIVGNGPIYGIKSSPTNNQQIGLIKTDSGGNTNYGCIINGYIAADTSSLNLNPVSFTTTTGGLTSILHPEVTDITLSSQTGCVPYLGSIDENESENIVIYPNPAQENITIEMATPGKDVSVSVYNMQGQLIMQQNIQKEDNQININRLSNGIYLLKVETEDQVRTIKFIKG